ncbi:MAG: hypothetical protein WC209_11790 [Ignavibacteriaceae bacterium]|jgi:hypothetical protein
MTYNSTLSILSAIFGLVGGIYFVLGTVLLSNEKINKISTTRYDSNIFIKRVFLFQRLDYSFGFVFLIVAFISQTVLAFLSKECSNSKISCSDYVLFISSIFITIFLSPILRHLIYKWIDKNNKPPVQD